MKSALWSSFVAEFFLAGCAAVEISPPIESCHDYRVKSEFGRFGIQQKAKGQAISWGAYPSKVYSGTWYRVTVRADGAKIDGKSQNYAPHGSVGAARAAKYSGKILSVSGTVTRDKELVLEFNMRCKIM